MGNRYVVGGETIKVLDLFSGLGGFSEAFLQAGDEVVRVENNHLLSEVPNTSIECVRVVRDRLKKYKESGHAIRDIDLILASPPCLEFSLAFNAPQAKAQRAQENYEPNMELVKIALEIIEIVKPRYWIIENVKGSRKHFQKLGLEVNQIIGPYFLYGNFPYLSCLASDLPSKASKDKTSSHPLRSNHKAMIPIELSQSVLEAVKNQRSLWDYIQSQAIKT